MAVPVAARATELPQSSGIEHQLIASGPQQIAMTKLCQGEADRLARHTNRLRKLMMRDAQYDALFHGSCRCGATEAHQRLDEAMIAVFEDQFRRFVARRLHFLRQLATEFRQRRNGGALQARLKVSNRIGFRDLMLTPRTIRVFE